MEQLKELERLETGIDGLDEVLGGGVPARSITVIAGEPGSGKTVLTLQSIFHAARAGTKCLYFTTLSEPAVKVIRYMQLFGFFDQRLLDDRIVLADLGTVLRTEGTEAALAELIERVEDEQPGVVVVDSFKVVHDMIEPARRRSFVYDLAVTMAGWGATTLLLGEYTEQEISALPEFAVADGILRLGAGRQELALLREIEVRKLRGSAFISGTHFFEIGKGGVEFFPRVRNPEAEPAVATGASSIERISTGIEGLDRLLRGGIPACSTTAVIGGTGTGKTLLGLSFLIEGARQGKPGVLLALEETPDQLRSTARGAGLDLEHFERQRLLRIEHTPPVELSTDRFLDRAMRVVRSTGAARVFLDSLSSLQLGAISERRFKELVYALTKHLRAAKVSTFMSIEVTQLLGTAQLSGHGISFAADNLVYLRYVESGGRLERAALVLKARGIEHSAELCALSITERGVRVGRPLEDLQGALTGLPSPTPQKQRGFER